MKKIVFSLIPIVLLSFTVLADLENKSVSAVNMTFANDDFLAKFNSYDTFYESERLYGGIIGNIIFWTNVEVKNFQIIKIDWGDDIDKRPIKLYPGKVLYSSDILLPNKPLFAQMTIEGNNDYLPVVGISYTDENNSRRYFYIPTGAFGNFTLLEFMQDESPLTGDNLWYLYIISAISVIAAVFIIVRKKRIS